MKHYNKEDEERIKNLFNSLSEKDRRRYAAVEASKLGHGGRKYIKELVGIDYKTLAKGLDELKSIDQLPKTRNRKPGGGRKKKSTGKEQN